ncbi:pH-response regulator protein, putative [Candida dubliniensis CD36]|uniref:PH-response regulator protein, putative n=1 Tax=Candida dubliniensis (strain CD36 / ATCC MYA-646 / CBS 7987 / NCPF 3949 / NRRL Y-17841) TaxID=573826 RepID=B9W8V9_CANDC|nr:pH-response regulator protein, putative [Candida dubliniensis CD36]CAX45183.1 pH-response regulator protein, putative [Candida dubliniensis CD36]
MNTNLLFIPLKQSSVLDLGEELRQVINNHYFQPASSFNSDLVYITDLRNQVAQIKNINNELGKTSQDDSILLQYLQVLGNLQKKFSDDCIEFAWFDTLTYGPRGPYRYRSLKIEKLNVIFQIGCLYSQVAISESRHTDIGLKRACRYFQLSAGCFMSINKFLISMTANTNNPLILSIPPSMESSTVQCLEYLMLAQAQETIWQKAINSDSMKDSVVARLSIQASEYYSKALDYGNSSDLIKLEWINHIKVKKFHFLAAAHLRSSTIAADAFQYGEQVAHLRVASQAVDKALKSKKYVSNLVLEDLQGLADVIKVRLRTAEKDNDLVYLKIVPQEKELKPIIGVSMVKSIVPEEFEKPESNIEIFKELLPYVIIHVAQAMRERQDEYIQTKIVTPIQGLNNMLVKFLIERDLPASIDSIQQPENIPDSVVRHSQEILKIGGIDFIEKAFKELDKLKIECNHLLQECQTRIELDRSEDEMLRRKQGSERWSRESTNDAAQELIEKIDKMKQYLQQANNGDSFVLEKFHDIKPALEVYSSGYRALSQYIPSSQYIELPDRLSIVISDLRNCLAKADILESERKEFLQNVELKGRDNNILPKLISEYNSNRSKYQTANGEFNLNAFENVYEKHMKLFDSDIRYIATTRNLQMTIEHEIDLINQNFVQEFKLLQNSSNDKRQKVLQYLETAYEKFLEIINNLTEGSKFYTDFIEKGGAVLQECEEYLYRRRVESRDLELAINNSFQQQQAQTQNEQMSVPKSYNNDKLVSPKTSKPGLWNPNSDIRFS